MLTVFRYALRRLRGQILDWGLGIAALGLIVVPFYDLFQEQQADYVKVLENYPPEVAAFFGEMGDLASPSGYLNVYLFSLLPVILGIWAVSMGSGLLASDEEGGRLDLILSYPVSRAALFFGRLLAHVAGVVCVCLIGWVGAAILLGGSSLDVSAIEIGLPFLPVLAQILVYATLTLLLSMVLPARRMASMVGGLVLVTSYVTASMGRIHEGLASVARLLPHHYYQGGSAMDGLDVVPFAALLGAGLILALLAWWRFERRDVRVAGEGSWRLPLMRRGRGAAA